MFDKRWISTALICACSVLAFGQERSRDEDGVRDLIARWNAAYRALDGKTQMPPFDVKPGEPLAVPYPPK